MNVEFIEGRCCGNCAKCEVTGRPRSQQGIQACAVANILPMVFCTHDLLIEQNALINKLTKIVKKQGEAIAELKGLAGECCCGDEGNGNGNPHNETEDETLEEQEDIKPEAKRLPKNKK